MMVSISRIPWLRGKMVGLRALSETGSVFRCHEMFFHEKTLSCSCRPLFEGKRTTSASCTVVNNFMIALIALTDIMGFDSQADV